MAGSGHRVVRRASAVVRHRLDERFELPAPCPREPQARRVLEHERVIEEMFAQQAAAFTKAASKGVVKDDGSPAVAEEETDVKDVRLLLKLLKV